ncbi:MAG TPA: OmpH family outer membrane protein [Bryobacteraceae bacterium]|nr:OmpH family outer membrane protein [Bryobacteraceae bacterium]
MKHRITALPCLALFVASMAGAQTPTKIGVIQIQQALVSTKDGQKAVADLETRMAPKQKEMERKRTEIQELQDKLSKGGAAMAQAAKDDLARTIDTKTKSFNRDMEDARAELDQEQRKLLEDLSGKMQVVIDKYAQTNGYAVILDVSNQNTNVLYVSTGVDITKDVIDLYDKMNPGGPSSKPSAPAAPKPLTPATPVKKP